MGVQEIKIGKMRALEITNDRIESLNSFIPENESQKKIADETIEYLKFVKTLLEEKESAR